MAGNQSKKVIYAALIGNSMIAVSKFIAASVTGSSAMLSEGIHSVVDSGNQLLIMHLSPQDILVNASIDFVEGQPLQEVEAQILSAHLADQVSQADQADQEKVSS